MSNILGINSYRILDTISRSRRFILYKAENLHTSEIVLIKTQDPSQVTDPILAESLVREAETACALNHPLVRRGFGVFREGLSAYMVAEYIEGKPLSEILSSNASGISFEQAGVWAHNILEALQFAHQHDIYHQNLNPYNIVIDSQNRARVIGIGKQRAAWLSSEGNVKYHHPILYIAPEVYRDKRCSTESDVYSWAVILYQILCGVLPWRVESYLSPEAQKQQSLTHAILMPEIIGKVVPDWLFTILLACLNNEASERYSIAFIMEVISTNVDIPISQIEPEIIPQPCNQTELYPLMETDIEKELSVEPEHGAKPCTDDSPIQDSEAVHEKEEEPQTIADITPPEPTIFEVSDPDEELTPSLIQEIIKAQEESSSKENQEEAYAPFSGLLDTLESVSEPQKAKIEVVSDTIIPESTPSFDEVQSPNVSSSIESKIPANAMADIPKEVTNTTTKSTYQSFKVPVFEDEKQEMGKLQKTFRLFLIISAITVLVVLFKYLVLEKRPKFESLDVEEQTTDELPSPTEENVELSMVKVPADTLVMGSISPEAASDEFPLLTIFVPSFLISTTEVTQAQWQMIYPVTPSQFRDPKLPVENVTFYDAIEFCNAKSLKDGLKPAYDYYGTEIICDFESNGYRLPTEAEWELAAKAGIGKNFQLFSGSADANDIGWFNRNSGAKTNPVGSKTPNALGIHDMSGNVYEWVWNWYAPYTFNVTNLLSGPTNGIDKVLRGGSWYHPENDMRTTARHHAKPFTKSGYIGFRVVRSR